MRRFLVLAIALLPAAVLAQDRYLVDWKSAGEESIEHLVQLIQIDTTNPPGNETSAANYVRDILAAEGIESTLYSIDAERANLVARIKGNGTKRPILIMGHTDVVGVQRDEWTVDPFAAVLKDGFIYGRGSLDDKDSVTAGLMVMLLLKRYDVQLDRDIIFLAEAGEEGTPQVGINYMVEHHWDAIDSEFCLAEGGGGVIENGTVKYVGIQTTEKMPRRVTLVARGKPGHGSVPEIENAVLLLANAISKAGAWQTEMRLNETTRAYFRRLATISEPDDAHRYQNIENPDESAAIQQHFAETFPYHYSLLRTSVVPTVINAGFRKNVIPSEASAILDIRMLPDENLEDFYQQLANVIDDSHIEIIPEEIYRPAAPPSKIDNEMFQILEKVSARLYPGAVVLPSMSTGATDMAQVRAKGVQAYGIGSVRTIEELTSGRGAHGNDERIAEEALLQFVKFYWQTVIEVAATR